MNKSFYLSVLVFFVAMIPLAGCRTPEQRSGEIVDNAGSGFWPASVHLKPSFTRIIQKDKVNQKPGSIEAFIELKDQFGDPIKSVGQFRFEVYKYQSGAVDSLGARCSGGLENVDLREVNKNQKHWDQTLGNYHFTLKLPNIPSSQKKIVLQVTFTSMSGKRYEDFLTIQHRR